MLNQSQVNQPVGWLGAAPLNEVRAKLAQDLSAYFEKKLSEKPPETKNLYLANFEDWTVQRENSDWPKADGRTIFLGVLMSDFSRERLSSQSILETFEKDKATFLIQEKASVAELLEMLDDLLG